MLHAKYFCNKTSNLLKRKIIEDECKMRKNFHLEAIEQEQLSQLTTVTNQMNTNTKLNLKPKPLYFPTMSQNFLDCMNDQNSGFYEKYIQNLSLLFPTTTTTTTVLSNLTPFEQNQMIKQHNIEHKSLTPQYSMPSFYSGIMSTILNNGNKQLVMNNMKQARNHEKQEPKLKPIKEINKSSSMNSINKQAGTHYHSDNAKTQKLKHVEPAMSTVALNFPGLQNCCAKCNTQFRLTSDLVYHMRTFHRRDESYTYMMFNNKNEVKVTKDHKQLKCEYCNESFKEKHHLTRHMTSHR